MNKEVYHIFVLRAELFAMKAEFNVDEQYILPRIKKGEYILHYV